MAIQIQGTTVIDQSGSYGTLQNVQSITYPDATVQTSASGGSGGGISSLYSAGTLVQTLNNPNAYSTSAADNFSVGVVSISGNYAIVGAYAEDELSGAGSGKAYIFNVSTGALVHTLTNPNAYSTVASDSFGYAVSISGNYAAVSAYNEDDSGGATSGKVYVFDVITGELLWTLNNPNAYSTSANDWFGFSLALSGNYIIVSAYLEDDSGGSGSGKVYIFNASTGALMHTINNPNAYSTSANDNFGGDVDISGNYAIVGTYGEGVAYIFNVTTGALVQALNNPNAYSTSAGDSFGVYVGISGNYAVVTAYQEDDLGGSASGKAYIFNATTGSLLYTIDNPNAYSTSANDWFGYNVRVNGNYAIIGATQEDDSGGGSSGKAYVYNVTSGTLALTLNNPNAYSTALNDGFGSSVSISGNYAIVGAYNEDDSGGAASGKAYIFAINNISSLDNIEKINFASGTSLSANSKLFELSAPAGSLLQILNNPTAYSTGTGDYFGGALAISGNYAVVGAYGEADSSGATVGKAYVFNVITGALLYTLSNPSVYSTGTGDAFGSKVAINDRYVVVGASNEQDASGLDSGAVYIFDVTTGRLLSTITNPTAYSTGAYDAFGTSISVSENYLAVGASGENDGPTGYLSGKVYVFNPTTGTLLYTLNNPNAYGTAEQDLFGTSVKISGNYLVVGAYGEADTSFNYSGKVYVFNLSTGTLLYTLSNPNQYSTSSSDYFGFSVAASGSYLAVSAYTEDDVNGTNSGKVYIYEIKTGALYASISNPNVYSTSTNDQFGFNISMSDMFIGVASGEDDLGGSGSGKTYILSVPSGVLLYTLSNPNAYSTSAGDVFARIDISGNYAIIGAQNETDPSGSLVGKAYIFSLTNQTYLDRLVQLVS